MSEIDLTYECSTSLSNSNNNIENSDDFAYYINGIIESDIRDQTIEIPYNSKVFGDVIVDIYSKWLLWDDFRFDIKVTIKTEDEIDTSVDIYDVINTDPEFVNFIVKNVTTYIEKINANINIMHPINENMIFYENKLYVETSFSQKAHEVEYVKFTIDSNIDPDELTSNFYIA